MQRKTWFFVAAVLALIGFADASYLAVEHWRGAIPPCTVGGCEQVLSSVYATIAGIPVAALGAGYYFALAMLFLLIAIEGKEKLLPWVYRILSIGLVATAYFVGLQFFVLKAICVYCMGSAITTTLLAGVAWRIHSFSSSARL